jgi:hypothetical protein
MVFSRTGRRAGRPAEHVFRPDYLSFAGTYQCKQKAERVAHSWVRRRERARTRGELLTTRLPA